MAKRDYYEVLGISKGAEADEVKSAYRKLALKYHPDRNPGDKAAEESFKEATEAYEILTDASKKAAYDQYGHAGVDPSAGGGFGGGGMDFDLSDALRAFMRDFGGFGGDPGGGGGRRVDLSGEDRQIKLPLDLREIATGTTKKVRVRKLVRCGTCAGKGSKDSAGTKSCEMCNGAGQIRHVQRSLFGQMVNVAVCPTCRGEGSVIQNPCLKCGGDGRVDGHETVEVKIPAGVSEGRYMVLRGLGDVGIRNAEAGNLAVIFTENADPVFTRHGRDLVVELPVHPHQLALGAKVEVPTLDGKVRMEVPEGVQSGKVLRLRGKGVVDVDHPKPGDLLVRLLVAIPTKLSTEERKAYETLAKTIGDVQPKVHKGFFEKVREAFSGS